MQNSNIQFYNLQNNLLKTEESIDNIHNKIIKLAITNYKKTFNQNNIDINEKLIIYKEFIEEFIRYIPQDYIILKNLNIIANVIFKSFQISYKQNPEDCFIKFNYNKEEFFLDFFINIKNTIFIIESINSMIFKEKLDIKFIFHPSSNNKSAV